MITHIINEAASPPDAFVWTMHCGDQCIVLNDDSLENNLRPEMDFYGEDDGEKADCEACKRALVASPETVEEVTA